MPSQEIAIPASKSGPASKWKCHKLESFSDFLGNFKVPPRKAPYGYLELFSGAGREPCDKLDCPLEGSALRALKYPARFAFFGFLTRTRKAASALETSSEQYPGELLRIISGNPNNEKVLWRLLDMLPRSASALVFIDPAGYRRLDWQTIERLARHGQNWQGEKVDLLIIFPLEMALLRNLMRPECQGSVTRFYGNHQWEQIKRDKNVRKWKPEEVKRKLVELYKAGLFGLGYRYVEDYKPSSPTHDPYFQIIYASDTVSRLGEIRAAWGKSRFLRCELLFGTDNKPAPKRVK
jgi:three-Cys-motif partner protein